MNNLEIDKHPDHLMVSNHYFAGVSESEIRDAYKKANSLFDLNSTPITYECQTYSFTPSELSEIKQKIILGEMYIQNVNKKENSVFKFRFNENSFLKIGQTQLEVYWKAKKKFNSPSIAKLITQQVLSLSTEEIEGFVRYLEFLENR